MDRETTIKVIGLGVALLALAVGVITIIVIYN